jgi:hypothetical protein
MAGGELLRRDQEKLDALKRHWAGERCEPSSITHQDRLLQSVNDFTIVKGSVRKS